MKKKRKEHVWVAYSKEEPGIPIAIADTCNQLADMIGVHRGTVMSEACRAAKGQKNKHAIYAKVEVDDAD